MKKKKTKQKTAILKVESINFGIKPKKEQETIMLAFQKFLNSIDFPIQILMTTETLDLNVYLDNLENSVEDSRNKEIFESYKSHMKNLIEKNSAMNRNFYIVIPEVTNLEIQISLCENRLHGLNLKTYRVGKKESKKIFSKIFSCEKTPKQIKNFPDYMIVEDKFHKIIYAHGYPRMVEKGFLDRLISCSGNFDFSLHVAPQPIEQSLVLLNRELQKQRADLYSAKIKNQLNPSLEIKYTDTRKVLENLQKGTEKLYNIGFYINCRADSVDELRLLTKKIESELNSLLILPRQSNFRMIDGFKSCLPLGKDYLNITRNITTSALSAFFPFTSQFLEADREGVWLGLNKNNIPIIKDIFNLSNPNGIVLAQSGGGKSYFCKLLIMRYLMNRTKVMIIDPQGEYDGVISRFEGQTIKLSQESDTIINPLDLMGHDYSEKRLSLIDLIKVMLGDLSDIQRAIVDKAITKTYELKGITGNPDTWNNEPPILEDLLEVLKKMEKQSAKVGANTINSLSSRLEMYVSGVFSFFNRKTKIDFDNNLVCFDLGKMPAQVKPAAMFLVLDYIYMKMKSDLSRKILLIDESWSLLSRAEEASYIFEIVKTCRKFNLGLLLINQEVEGLLDSKAGKSVLANSAYTVLMRQKPAVIDEICKTFHLSSIERTHLLTAGIGEGILIMENEHSELRVIAAPEEHRLITTKADEVVEMKKNVSKKRGRDIVISVDENDRFFRKKKLNKDEIEYLLSKKYRIEKRSSLASGKIEEFLLQPRHNESATHLFVIHDIAEYLEKKGVIVEKYVTRKPDLVFKYKKEKWAIEVETGGKIKKDPKMIESKVAELNKNYDKWFFVITNNLNLKEYKKLGETVELRSLRGRIDKLLK